MYVTPLDAVPLPLFLALAIAVSLFLLEAGYRFGRWRRAVCAGEKDGPVGAMVASILALVAIMVAFTFNLAAIRFEARRQVVLDEANAIGTTWLRTSLLPEPEGTTSAALLKEYVDVRLEAARGVHLAEGIARSEEIHTRLWRLATAAAGKDRSVMTSLYIQSLNDVIDLHSKRLLVSLRSRMPSTIWVVLFSLALLGMAAIGYQAGLAETRRTPAAVLVALSFVVVLYLIVDLDRAHEGLLHVSQQTMIDLQKSMQSPPER